MENFLAWLLVLVYLNSLSKKFSITRHVFFPITLNWFLDKLIVLFCNNFFLLTNALHKGSRHSSYTSHASRMSYTSHGDLLGGLGSNGKVMTKESQLKNRSMRNGPAVAGTNFVEITPKAHRGDYVRFSSSTIPSSTNKVYFVGWSNGYVMRRKTKAFGQSIH